MTRYASPILGVTILWALPFFSNVRGFPLTGTNLLIGASIR